MVLLVILLNPFTLASLLFNSRATDTEFLETIVLFLVFSGGVIVLWLIPILWAGLLISVVSKAVRKISAALREGTTYEDFWFFLVYNRPVDKGSMYRYELDEEPNQKIITKNTCRIELSGVVMTTNNNQPIEDQLEFSDEPVLLMSPKVIHGRPRPRLRCIDRGEVQGILTEGTSSAWKVGKVVGYVPIEKSRETFDAKGFFTDWDGFTLYVLGPVLRMAFWSSLLSRW